MTTTYSPWANGRVEKVNNDIQKLLRSPFDRTGNGIFPIATSTSCDSVCFESLAFSVSSKLCPPQDHNRPGRPQPAVRGKIERTHERLEEISGEIYRKVETSVRSSRATKRRNANKKRSPAKFDKGDYVLVSVTQPQNLSKLQPRWNGPYQITEVVSDWKFSSNTWSPRLRK
jgi:hypothetical protein